MIYKILIIKSIEFIKNCKNYVHEAGQRLNHDQNKKIYTWIGKSCED